MTTSGLIIQQVIASDLLALQQLTTDHLPLSIKLVLLSNHPLVKMQFLTLLTTVVIAASSAVARPGDYTPPAAGCKPGTYSCAVGKYGQQGWQICDVSALWVYGGDCPPHTACHFNELNQSPYCI
ncbi:hypothetical protein BN1723_006787 [Verticillium longisporum]|uniref:Uncharacterized protein n=1 Tax=Verticillium longisporum TaxID=100787 RepID=A0A0G4NHR5_VERLO|nr:hypothetical protein BN1708_011604 [Verticillium longisporum]CRK45946.1 hypothetical protein BN1723_006787 [Verticillium longisporum]